MKSVIHKLIVATHVFWALVLLISFPLTILFTWYHNIAISLVAFTLIVQLLFRGCPLTVLENHVRADPYNSTFLGHFFRTVFKKDISDFWVEVIVGIYFTILVLLSLPWHGMGF